MSFTETKLTFIFSLLCYASSAGFAFAQVDDNAKPAQNVVEAGPFRIHVHCDNQKVVDQVQRIGDQTWRIASKFYACELPDEKLNAHLYRNIDGYNAADEKLTGGKFKKNQAFADYNSMSAHVAMQPPISDQLLNIVGLPKQSARLLAHEMAHLVRCKRMPNTFGDHPDWLIDGAALHIGKQVITSLGYMDQPMSDPNFSTKAAQIKKLLGQNKLPSAKKILENVPLELPFYERYSVQWVFLDMLMSKHKEKFLAFMKGLPRIGGGQGYAKRSKDSVSYTHLTLPTKA